MHSEILYNSIDKKDVLDKPKIPESGVEQLIYMYVECS
jgi:hypothetical protein